MLLDDAYQTLLTLGDCLLRDIGHAPNTKDYVVERFDLSFTRIRATMGLIYLCVRFFEEKGYAHHR